MNEERINVDVHPVVLPPVLDACCGSRMFWFDKSDGRAPSPQSGSLLSEKKLISTPCSLTAFLSFAFLMTGISAVILIVGLAVWLPVEIEKDSETIKERNDLILKRTEFEK